MCLRQFWYFVWQCLLRSGPKRYDFVQGRWIYRHDGVSLHQLLTDELRSALPAETTLDFTSCAYGLQWLSWRWTFMQRRTQDGFLRYSVMPSAVITMNSAARGKCLSSFPKRYCRKVYICKCTTDVIISSYVHTMLKICTKCGYNAYFTGWQLAKLFIPVLTISTYCVVSQHCKENSTWFDPNTCRESFVQQRFLCYCFIDM